MIAYVLDASVAAKWVLPSRSEPFNAEAVHILERFTSGKITLSVPDLFWPEIGNILWKSARIGRISEQSASEAIDWFLALGLLTLPTSPLVGDALPLAMTLDRTVYDALYLVLAIRTGKQLLTADERLANALGSRFPVHWLGAIT